MNLKQSFFRKTALLLSVVLLFAALATACGSKGTEGGNTNAQTEDKKGEDGKLTKVRLQLKWLPQTQFGGYFVALDKGYYKEEGLDVEILSGGPDIVPEQQVANGAAEIGNSWVAGLLSHQEEGFPLIEIAQISQRSSLVLVSKKDKGINSPADLKGKKVGSWMAGLEFEILALLEKYKLKANEDVSIVKQGFTMDQFIDGSLDVASALTHNEYPMLLEQGMDPNSMNVIDMNDEGVAMLQDNLFVNSEWLANNKETAAKFLRASFKGWAEAIENPEAATDIVMKYVDKSSTTREHQLSMMKAIGALVLPEGMHKSKIGQIDVTLFQQTADIAFNFGVVKKKVDLQKAYTNEILDLAAQ